MRIAFRRPDGAWHFGDSLTPFTPAGVNDIDVLRPPSTSTCESFNALRKEKKAKVGHSLENGFLIIPSAPSPPAYHPESHNEHVDGDSPQV